MNVKVRYFIGSVNERYLSTSKQVQRIILFAAIALVLVVGSFAGYYHFDMYYSNQQPVSIKNLNTAEQALKDNPADLNARQILAETYLLNGNYDQALAQASIVFAGDPTLQRAWLVIGVANALNGKPAGAIIPLTNYYNSYKDEDMAGLDKPLQEAVYYLGDSYLQLGQPANAIPILEKSVGWNRMDADAMYKLGLAYSSVGRYEDAVNIFAQAVSFVPNYTEVYQAMAKAYDSGNLPILGDYARGMAFYSQKDYPAALELLNKAALVYPKYAPIFAGLGLSYEAMNDLQNARSSFDAALAIDSNNDTAMRGVERVNAILNK